MKEEIWKEAREKIGSVNLDTYHNLAVIYKGIKLTKDDVYGVRIYSTDNDFYTDITDTFIVGNFQTSVDEYLKLKYISKLELIERLIKNEINTNKNHKRFNYLKTMRKNYLKKYNEINTRKTKRR